MAGYARHGLAENALLTFVLILKENIRPTEFTLSCALSCASTFLLVELGSQLHSLVVKLGFESDSIVASSLMEMYSKCGLIDSAMEIFTKIDVKDLISWNTMIAGLTCNGKIVECIDLFKQQCERGPPPDQITLTGVLLACNYGGFVDEGMAIFSSMEKKYGVKQSEEHYSCVVDMMSRAGKLKEAMCILERMPFEPSAVIWKSILGACAVHGHLKFTERVAERLMKLEPQSSLPYAVLARAYEMRGRWESLVRVRKVMKERSPKRMVGCSWIWMQSSVFVFNSNQIVQYGGHDIYSILRLLMWEMVDEDLFFNSNVKWVLREKGLSRIEEYKLSVLL